MKKYGMFKKKDFDNILDIRENLYSKIHNRFYKDFEIFANYDIYYAKNIDEVMKLSNEFGIYEFNLGNDFKKDIIKYCDILSESSQLTDCVDTIKVEKSKIIGYNSLFLSIELVLYILNLNLLNKKIVIDVNSESAKSLALALSRLNVKKLILLGKDRERKMECYELIKKHSCLSNVIMIEDYHGLVADIFMVTSDDDIFDKSKFLNIDNMSISTYFNASFLEENNSFIDYMKEKNNNYIDSSIFSVVNACMSEKIWNGNIAYGSYILNIANDIVFDRAKRTF